MRPRARRHFKDPTGESIKRMFDGVTYVNLPWTQAKVLGFFPSVDYLEALPTLKRGNDLKTYASILEQHQKRSSSVRPFVSELERSLESYRSIAPRDVVKTVLDYQRSRCEAGQAPKRRVLVFCSSINEADEVARREIPNPLKPQTSCSEPRTAFIPRPLTTDKNLWMEDSHPSEAQTFLIHQRGSELLHTSAAMLSTMP